jgi:hypothetical protein
VGELGGHVADDEADQLASGLIDKRGSYLHINRLAILATVFALAEEAAPGFAHHLERGLQVGGFQC